MLLYVLIIGIVLFPQGQCLNCFTCSSDLPNCPKMTCPAEMDHCGALRIITYNENSKILDVKSKSCLLSQHCIKGSVSLGGGKTVFATECCNSNLCNKNYAAEPPKPKSNGKKCYRCDVQGDCSGTLDCDGDEDMCIKVSVNKNGKTHISKGCASRSVCTSDGKGNFPGFSDVYCCEGDYCNGANGATASLLLLAAMLISTFFFSS